jgi:hypothetical protein
MIMTFIKRRPYSKMKFTGNAFHFKKDLIYVEVDKSSIDKLFKFFGWNIIIEKSNFSEKMFATIGNVHNYDINFSED